MKKGIFFLLLAGLWLGCKTPALTDGDPEFHKEPGTDKVATTNPKTDTGITARIPSPDTADDASIAGNQREWLELQEADSIEHAKDSLLAVAMAKVWTQKKVELTYDTLTDKTMDLLAHVADTMRSKDSLCLTGYNLAVFGAKCRQKRADGIQLNSIESAILSSSSIDTLQLWHGYVHVSYKPLTGYVFKTYFLGKITKQVETPLKEEQVIALLKKKRGKG